MTIRLVFAFCFQWTVTAASRALAWLIPDRPRSLDLKIKRQEYLAKEALRKYKIKIGKRKPDKENSASEEEEDEEVSHSNLRKRSHSGKHNRNSRNFDGETGRGSNRNSRNIDGETGRGSNRNSRNIDGETGRHINRNSGNIDGETGRDSNRNSRNIDGETGRDSNRSSRDIDNNDIRRHKKRNSRDQDSTRGSNSSRLDAVEDTYNDENKKPRAATLQVPKINEGPTLPHRNSWSENVNGGNDYQPVVYTSEYLSQMM